MILFVFFVSFVALALKGRQSIAQGVSPGKSDAYCTSKAPTGRQSGLPGLLLSPRWGFLV